MAVERLLDRWYTLRELAFQWSIEPSTLQRLVEDGALHAVRFGDEWRVSSASATTYVDRQSNTKHRRRSSPRSVVGAAVAAALVFGVTAALLRAQGAGLEPSVALPYQGYLELAGAPITGKRFVTFTLFNADGSPTGWSEGKVIDVAEGHFGTVLGTQTTLDGVLGRSGGSLLVGVAVQDVDSSGTPTGTIVSLAGRQLLGSVPYARRGAPGKDFAVDGNIAAASVALAGGMTASSVAVGGGMTSSSATVTGLVTANAVASAGDLSVGGNASVTGRLAVSGGITAGVTCRDTNTECSDDGGGIAYFLDRHRVGCDDGEFVTVWKLARCSSTTIRIDTAAAVSSGSPAKQR